MLRWFRVHASRVAFMALVSFAVLGASTVTPHEDDGHDVGCGAMAVEHDASAHRIGGPSTEGGLHPLHCLVCHWARSFRPRTETKFLSTPPADAGTTIHVELFTAAASSPAAQPPARSPPVSPVVS